MHCTETLLVRNAFEILRLDPDRLLEVLAALDVTDLELDHRMRQAFDNVDGLDREGAAQALLEQRLRLQIFVVAKTRRNADELDQIAGFQAAAAAAG